MKIICLLTFLLSIIVVSTSFGNLNLGVVDLKKALHEVNAGKKAKAKLEKEFNARKAKLDKKQKKIQKMREDFEKKITVLSQEARIKEGQKIEKELQVYRELLGKSQMEMQKREGSLTDPILKDLESEIQLIAKERKFSVVLEKSQSAVVFNNKDLDITSELIKRYNKKHK